MSKTIYLDIDGVLNGHEWCHLGKRDTPSINAEPARVLNTICVEHDPQVIICSTWREKMRHGHLTPQGFQWLLSTHGVMCRVVGPLDADYNTPRERSEAIQKHANSDDQWIVIDDLELHIPNRHVRPNPGRGLEPYHVKMVRELFARMA